MSEDVSDDCYRAIMDDRENWLTKQEAADVAGVSLSTFSRWMSRGAISRAPLPGRIVRINKAHLLSLLTHEPATAYGNQQAS